MDNCGLRKRFSHWLCKEPKKSNNGKSRELHCSIERSCAFFRPSYSLSMSKTPPLIAGHFVRTSEFGTWITVILISSAWYSPEPEELNNVLCQEGKDNYHSGCQYLRKTFKDIVRIRTILFESWTGGENACALVHWISGPGMSCCYRWPHNIKELSLV